MCPSEKEDHQGENLISEPLSLVVKEAVHSAVNTSELVDSRDKQKSTQERIGESPINLANNNNNESGQPLIVEKDPIEVLKKSEPKQVQSCNKLLNKKRKKDVHDDKKKKKKLVKKYFDLEAEEEGDDISIYNKEDFEDGEDGDYEDSFIDNEENDILTNPVDYRNIDLKIQTKHIIEKPVSKDNIAEFKTRDLKVDNKQKPYKINFNQQNESLPVITFENLQNFFDIKCYRVYFDNAALEGLNDFVSRFSVNLKCEYEFNEQDILFGRYTLLFFYRIIKFFVKVFKADNPDRTLQFDMWNDLDTKEIEVLISDYFKFLIKNNTQKLSFILNAIDFFVFNYTPTDDLKKVYIRICEKFNSEVDPQNVRFKILKSEKQTKKEFVEVSLDDYQAVIKTLDDFYKDKPADYEEKLSAELKKKDEKNRAQNKVNNEYLSSAYYELNMISNNYRLNTGFEGDFSAVDDYNAYNQYNKKLRCSSFGFVIYMDKLDYNHSNDSFQNESIHFPHSLLTMVKGVLFYLSNFIAYKHPKQILISHEHGTILKKCHCQGMIKFYDQIHTVLKPGSFQIRLPNNDNFQTYLIMFQSAKNVFALENYIKKKDEVVPFNKFFNMEFEQNKNVLEHFTDFCAEYVKNNLNAQSAIDFANNKVDKNEYFVLLVNTPNLDVDTLKNMIISKNDVTFTKYVIQNFDKIMHFNKLANQPEIPDFKWTFPPHALDYIKNYDECKPGFLDTPKYSFFKICYDWFKCYCEKNDPNYFDNKNSNRKVGLLVYGIRDIGKTTFFQNWCGDFPSLDANPFIIYCRNTISWEKFEKKINTAQLIILDDVDMIKSQKELIKALIVGQGCDFRSLYVDNKTFNKSIPCVILTNNIYILNYFMKSPEFNNCCCMCGIDFYIGPDGTQPNRNTITFLSPGIQSDYDDFCERVKKNKQNKNNNRYVKFAKDDSVF